MAEGAVTWAMLCRRGIEMRPVELAGQDVSHTEEGLEVGHGEVLNVGGPRMEGE